MTEVIRTEVGTGTETGTMTGIEMSAGTGTQIATDTETISVAGIVTQAKIGIETEAEAETGAVASIGLGAEAGSTGEMTKTGNDMTGEVRPSTFPCTTSAIVRLQFRETLMSA